MAGGGKVIFEDRTSPWVPFATVGLLTVVLWFALLWESGDLVLANIGTFFVFVAMVIALPLQGRLFWARDIAILMRTDTGLEARTSQWIGWGRRLRFTPAEASWAGVAAERPKLILTLRNKDYTLDLKTAQVVDREALGFLAPEAMAAVAHPPPSIATAG